MRDLRGDEGERANDRRFGGRCLPSESSPLVTKVAGEASPTSEPRTNGGAVAGRQLLTGGFVDELRLHLVHLLLGAGTPLFEPPGVGFRRLPVTRLVQDTGVTHFTFDASGAGTRFRPS